MPANCSTTPFFRRRLEVGHSIYAQLGYTDPRGAARLVFSEADGLSGLIVDRYGEYLSMQATSLAVWQRLDEIVPLLSELLHPRGIVLRQEHGAVQMEGMPHEEGRHWGDLPDGPVFIEEHGTALRRRFARRAQNWFLSRSARKSPRGGQIMPAVAACSICSATAAASR